MYSNHWALKGRRLKGDESSKRSSMRLADESETHKGKFAWKLRWMSDKWLKLKWHKQGPVADYFQHSNRLQSSMKVDG